MSHLSTNLPSTFPEDPKPIHYFSLLFSHGMINSVRQAMNGKYREALNNSYLLKDMDEHDGSIDPLNPTSVMTFESGNHATIDTVQITKLNPRIYTSSLVAKFYLVWVHCVVRKPISMEIESSHQLLVSCHILHLKK